MSPDQIAVRLRDDMLSGTLLPGAELSQPVLAKRFGVSRIPVRDALRDLAGEGLVEVVPNRGACVVSLTAEQVREIYDLRILLECDCLERGAARMRPGDIEALDRVRRKSDIDADTPQWAESEWVFHHALYVHAGRPRQVAIIGTLRRTCQIHVSAYATLPEKTPKWLHDHRNIVDHLRSGNVAQAVAVLKDHLEASARHLLKRMS